MRSTHLCNITTGQKRDGQVERTRYRDVALPHSRSSIDEDSLAAINLENLARYIRISPRSHRRERERRYSYNPANGGSEFISLLSWF